MVRTLLALALSSAVVLLGVPRGRARAFKGGWFERSGQTRRKRSQRRPTHGGLVLAGAIAAAAVLAGPSQPVVRAVVAAAVLAVATGGRAERAKGPLWLVPVGRLAAASTLPAVGIRAGLTGSTAVDAVLTVLGALALMRALRAIERTDGTAPLVTAIAAAALVVVAVRAGDPAAPVAAALVGASLAMVAHAWPPAMVRVGAIGPTVTGAALAATAVALEPAVAAPRSMLVPLLALLPLAAAVLLPEWDRRLGDRGVHPQLALAAAAVAAAVAAERLAAGALDPVPALALAAGPTAVLALIGLVTPRRRPEGVDARRRHAALVGLAALVLVAVAAVAGLVLREARQDMVAGREAATDGLDAARAGDLGRARALFRTADIAFGRAADRLDHPAVRLGELVPGIAPNLRNARTLADVGGELSGTAVAVADRAGADDLLVVDGRFPGEAARTVSTELASALATLHSASARLAGTDSPLLLGEVRDGADAVAERIGEAAQSIEVVAEATRLAPALLGADGDRRWMVAVLTPSEQRGAGGLAGDYAELRTSGGDIDLVRQLPASELNGATDPARQLAALPAVYRQRYGGFRVGRFWQNLSATPDVPTFGQAIAAAFPLTAGGGPVDGVITVDPFAIAALLELTGPVTVPDWPVPLTADNAASVLLFEHYDRLTEAQIDTFQGDVIAAVVDALTTGTLPPISEIARTLGPQVTGGHLHLWSSETDPQALFERIGADGTLGARPPGSDFIQLVTQNSGENKIDWFLRRALSYEAVVDPASGALQATATVTITNTAPTSGVSSYIIGEVPGPTRPGENKLEVTLYSPHWPVRITDGTGADLPVNLARERGLVAVTVYLAVPAGAEATVVVTFEGTLPPTDGAYQLTVGRQPAVVPDRVDARVDGDGGWHLPSAAVGRLSVADDGPGRLEVTLVR